MAKFKVGDKVKLNPDAAKFARFYNLTTDFLTIIDVYDCYKGIIYRCDKTGCISWKEDDFEDTKYITNSKGDVIGAIPMNSIPVVIEEKVDEMRMFFQGDMKMKADYINMPEIKNYTYNTKIGLTTIEWCDGTQTIVRAENPDKADQFTGFMTAYAKKAAGNTNRINNLFDEWTIEKPKRYAESKAKEERIIADTKAKEERNRAKREKWLIRREAIRIKREYEARKLANEKYGVPMDGE